MVSIVIDKNDLFGHAMIKAGRWQEKQPIV